MKSVVIVGAGGLGREVLEIFKDQNKTCERWNILGFIDDNQTLHGRVVNGYQVLGGQDWFRQNGNGKVSCVCAIADSSTRRSIISHLDEFAVDYVNAIHPSVVMSDSVRLGKGVIIAAGTILTANIEIGNHVIINLSCTIGHDAFLDSFCTLSPSVNVNGADRLGEGVFVGTGVAFCPNLAVGDWAVIGAGAVVLKDIPEESTAVGVPARVIKTRTRRAGDDACQQRPSVEGATPYAGTRRFQSPLLSDDSYSRRKDINIRQ